MRSLVAFIKGGTTLVIATLIAFLVVFGPMFIINSLFGDFWGLVACISTLLFIIGGLLGILQDETGE